MTQRSAATTEVARRLWARAAGDTNSPEEVAAAAERTCTQLRTGLGRWIGAMGYHALLDRALALARAEHPALRSLSCHGGEEPMITAAVRAHGAAEVATGMLALVAGLVELLGRIIGEEIAVRLVEQAGMRSETERETDRERQRETAGDSERERPSPRGVVSTESKGGHDARVG
jgi:hypothetical protein